MTQITSSRRHAFGVIFLLLGLVMLLTPTKPSFIAIRILQVWLAGDAVALGLAYLLNWPGIFGKTPSGSFRLPYALLMLPLRYTLHVVWLLQNLLLRTPRYNEIAPNIFVGRIICEFAALPAGVNLFVDLTAEFQTPRSVREKIDFLCLPTLDGCSPNLQELRDGFWRIAHQPRRVYACCANGHGRSVTWMAAWLTQIGQCHSGTEAVKLIQSARPSAAPNRDQLSFLDQYFNSESLGKAAKTTA